MSDQKARQSEQIQEKLQNTQKMVTLGALAAGIAHDFNNLLGVMLGMASTLRLRLSPDDPVQESLALIEQAAKRAAGLTHELLGFLHPENDPWGPTHVQKVLECVAKMASQTFDRRIQVRTDWVDEPLWVKAESSELEQALLNLAINARDAMPEGGTLVLVAGRVGLEPSDAALPPQCLPGEYIKISVRDTGTGIEPQHRARIFDPFFTTKESGRGTGLGLAMVAEFARRHGGFVVVQSEVGLGSEFTLWLPALRAENAEAPPREKAELRLGTGTVLVVDDEPLVLAFAEQGLRRLGYEVLLAESARQALEIYRQRAREISWVLLDVVMPEMSGLEICRRMRAINPQARVIASSGYSRRVARQALEAGASSFVGKPYTLEELSVALQGETRG